MTDYKKERNSNKNVRPVQKGSNSYPSINKINLPTVSYQPHFAIQFIGRNNIKIYIFSLLWYKPVVMIKNIDLILKIKFDLND